MDVQCINLLLCLNVLCVRCVGIWVNKGRIFVNGDPCSVKCFFFFLPSSMLCVIGIYGFSVRVDVHPSVAKYAHMDAVVW